MRKTGVCTILHSMLVKLVKSRLFMDEDGGNIIM